MLIRPVSICRCLGFWRVEKDGALVRLQLVVVEVKCMHAQRPAGSGIEFMIGIDDAAGKESGWVSPVGPVAPCRSGGGGGGGGDRGDGGFASGCVGRGDGGDRAHGGGGGGEIGSWSKDNRWWCWSEFKTIQTRAACLTSLRDTGHLRSG